MTDQPQQPEVIDPDNVPETLCEGSFNISFTGPLAGIKPIKALNVANSQFARLLPVLIDLVFSYRGCGNRALSIELIDAAEKG